MNRSHAAALCLSLAMLPCAAANADDGFFRGKQVSMYVGYSAGGGYDAYARLLARHFDRHVPGNPTIVVQNMPGGGSLRLANWLYNVAPRDGTALGAVARGIAFDTLLGSSGSQFDAQKFNWIGSINNEVSVCVSWKDSTIRTFEDLYSNELVVGGTAGGDTEQFPLIMNGVLGSKFRVVTGYRGGNDVNIAMERGEVAGRCGWSWSSLQSTRAQWLKDGTVNVLVQLSLGKHPDLPDVPLITDLAKTPEQKAIMRLVFARQVMGRPIVAPPDIPADRVATLRKAFMETMRDPQFRAEADKANLEVEAVDGKAVQDLVDEGYTTDPAVVKKVSGLIQVSK